MEMLWGVIPAAIGILSFYFLRNNEKLSVKSYLFRLSFIIILLVVVGNCLVKWYEVPVHYNRFACIVGSKGTYRGIRGSLAIDVVYDYNRASHLLDLRTGFPESLKSGLYIEAYAKTFDHYVGAKTLDSLSLKFPYPLFDSNYSTVSSVKNPYRTKIDYNELRDSCLNHVNRDKGYLSYLKDENVYINEDSTISGHYFIIDLHSNKRQTFYPYIYIPWKKYDRIYKDTIIKERRHPKKGILIYEDSILRKKNHFFDLSYDEIWDIDHWPKSEEDYKQLFPSLRPDSFVVNHMLSSSSSIGDLSSSASLNYWFIPHTDSLIYEEFTLMGGKYKSPNILFSAEDISQAIEVFRIEGNFQGYPENLTLKRLTFNYIGAAEFSKMSPTPDSVDISKIYFTDKSKLRQIEKEGLRFHVKFPDMENIQQMRLFAATCILTFLLNAFFVICFELSKKIYSQFDWDKKINWKICRWVYLFLLIFLSIIIAFSFRSANLDPFNVDF